MVECSPNMHKALGWIHSTTKTTTQEKNLERSLLAAHSHLTNTFSNGGWDYQVSGVNQCRNNRRAAQGEENFWLGFPMSQSKKYRKGLSVGQAFIL